MGRRERDQEGAGATITRKAWRLGAWSGIAILCVAAAVVAAYTETGAHRLASSDAAMRASGAPPAAADSETRRLADAVRVLTADRDRLAARVSALERNLDDVTGAIPNRPGSDAGNPAASPLPPSLAPGPPAAAPATAVAAPTNTVTRTQQAPAASRPPGSVAITSDDA